MTKAELIHFWEEAGRDTKKRTFFHREFGDWLKSMPDEPDAPEQNKTEKKITRQRSIPQNNSLHKDCAIIADKLNAVGATMDKVLKDGFTMQWTDKNVAAMFEIKDFDSVKPMLTLVATCLNESGYEPIAYIKNSDNSKWWTTKKVKEFLWRSVQVSLYRKESTTELEKTSGEIDRIHEIIMRELGEKYEIEWHDFPHDPNRTIEENQGYKLGHTPQNYEYPEYNGEPTI